VYYDEYTEPGEVAHRSIKLA